jgi:hypothetical protein
MRAKQASVCNWANLQSDLIFCRLFIVDDTLPVDGSELQAPQEKSHRKRSRWTICIQLNDLLLSLIPCYWMRFPLPWMLPAKPPPVINDLWNFSAFTYTLEVCFSAIVNKSVSSFMFMASSESGSARRAYSYEKKCVFLDVWDMLVELID